MAPNLLLLRERAVNGKRLIVCGVKPISVFSCECDRSSLGSAIGHILCEEKSDRELGKFGRPLGPQRRRGKSELDMVGLLGQRLSGPERVSRSLC